MSRSGSSVATGFRACLCPGPSSLPWRHPLPIAQAGETLPLCQQELAALIAQVQALAEQFASQPTRRAHLTLAQLQLGAALRSLEDAARSLALAQRVEAVHLALDTAA